MLRRQLEQDTSARGRCALGPVIAKSLWKAAGAGARPRETSQACSGPSLHSIVTHVLQNNQMPLGPVSPHSRGLPLSPHAKSLPGNTGSILHQTQQAGKGYGVLRC